MHKKQPSKGLGYYEKVVTKTTKYDYVGATINSGLTVDKVKIITATEYAKRRSEIFYRLSGRQLSALFEEYEQEEYESIREAAENTGQEGSPSHPKMITHTETAEAINTKPYLILDTREVAEYRACHLVQARSFPFAYMRRDQVHPEYYNFRNKPESLIILYCEDERISRDAAKLMVDRGCDNVFLLSGGLAAFANEYPEYIEGQLPQHLSPKRGGLTRAALARISEDDVAPDVYQSAPFQTSPIPKKFPQRGYPQSNRSSRLSERSFGNVT